MRLKLVPSKTFQTLNESRAKAQREALQAKLFQFDVSQMLDAKGPILGPQLQQTMGYYAGKRHYEGKKQLQGIEGTVADLGLQSRLITGTLIRPGCQCPTMKL